MITVITIVIDAPNQTEKEARSGFKICKEQLEEDFYWVHEGDDQFLGSTTTVNISLVKRNKHSIIGRKFKK